MGGICLQRLQVIGSNGFVRVRQVLQNPVFSVKAAVLLIAAQGGLQRRRGAAEEVLSRKRFGKDVFCPLGGCTVPDRRGGWQSKRLPSAGQGKQHPRHKKQQKQKNRKQFLRTHDILLSRHGLWMQKKAGG